MTIEEMSIRFSPKQDELFKKIRPKMKEITCFEWEGVLYKGKAIRAAMDFIWNNPTGGDFHVWLQDNYKNAIIKQ